MEYLEEELKIILSESYKNFQQEKGFNPKKHKAKITRSYVHYDLDEEGLPLNNGEDRKYTTECSWSEYLFGRHLDYTNLYIYTHVKKSFRIENDYLIPVLINRDMNSRLNWIKKNLNHDKHVWKDYLKNQLYQIQFDYTEATPKVELTNELCSYIEKKFNEHFNKEFTQISKLSIPEKKIKFSLNQNDIAILFGLLIKSGIIDNYERSRLAQVIEEHFCTVFSGKGNKPIPPINLYNMAGKLNSAVSKLHNKETSAINTKEKIISLLKKE